MDGSPIEPAEHSDSDSGESWTLLENSPSYADEAPDFTENLAHGVPGDNNDKDEDTDGISIISDSEPESPTPCDLKYDSIMKDPPLEDETCPTELAGSYISAEPPLPSNNIDDPHEYIRSDDDFLGDSTGKLKTYVHRRNKRLSTVLNIIVLGSVITAAGVAIGHMWGVRDDCSLQTTPSVNKILSNLYKLQEENAFLRNKLREVTLLNNIQTQYRKTEADKMPIKHFRCKKVFEESLNNKNADRPTKCVDNEFPNVYKITENHNDLPEHERQYLNDIDKLKNIYKQNKSWLDEEITKRIKVEEQNMKNLKNDFKNAKIAKTLKNENLKRQIGSEGLSDPDLAPVSTPAPTSAPAAPAPEASIDTAPEKIVTYADSLKSHKDSNGAKRSKRETNSDNDVKPINRKKKAKREYEDAIADAYSSDEDLKKDDRYVPKMKQERKKHDRQKLHKKQKRRNKYEQWEMKGGIMKDYDESSLASTSERQGVGNPDRERQSRDFERKNYMEQFSEDTNKNKAEIVVEEKAERPKGEKEENWFDKRAVLRTEARRRLEQELLGARGGSGGGASGAGSAAGWYFRRMQRREQCRAKPDNSTHRKLSKRNMNFKTKH